MGKVYLTLDEVLTRRSISRYELAKRTGIRYPIIDNYYKNKVVRYDSTCWKRYALPWTAPPPT